MRPPQGRLLPSVPSLQTGDVPSAQATPSHRASQPQMVLSVSSSQSGSLPHVWLKPSIQAPPCASQPAWQQCCGVYRQRCAVPAIDPDVS